MSLDISGFMNNFACTGGLYKPREQKLRVGSELAPISSSSISIKKNDNNMVVAAGDDVRFSSLEIFDRARSAAQGGSQVKNFRNVDIRNLDLATKDHLYEDSSHKITFSEGSLYIYEKDATGMVGEKPAQIFKITDDARLVRGEDGGFSLLQGAEARTGGKLKAVGADEILILKSGAAVEAGSNTTVLNLSEGGSSFSGGENVTYLGSYQGASITGGAGKTVYAGYFANVDIEAEEGTGTFSGVFEDSKIKGWESDEFSGYFSRVEINAGDGENVFKGMFLNGSTLVGGEGNDNFNGRFIDSKVDGGLGKDKFGNGSPEKNHIVVKAKGGGEYYGIAADFVDSEVSAGEGNDKFDGVMHGGQLDMGDGGDEVDGVFSKASVTAGNGADSISAIYSQSSVFDAGDGKDSINIGTAAKSSIISGSGENEISTGANMNDAEDEAISGVTWTSVETINRVETMASGELRDNEINSEQGESEIDIYNGAGVNSLKLGPGGDAINSEQMAGKTNLHNGLAINALAGEAAKAADGTESSGASPGGNSANGEAAEPGPQDDIDANPDEAQNVSGQGGAALPTGPVAVTVYSAFGQREMFRGIERPEIEILTFDASTRAEEKVLVNRVTRRSDGLGGYNWVKSLK